MLGIFFIRFVPVCLPFERDGGIGLRPVSGQRQPDEPLRNIKEIEADPQQFSLLKGMNILMIQADIRQLLSGKNNAKKIDGYHVAPEWYDMIAYDSHFALSTLEQ